MGMGRVAGKLHSPTGVHVGCCCGGDDRNRDRGRWAARLDATRRSSFPALTSGPGPLATGRLSTITPPLPLTSPIGCAALTLSDTEDSMYDTLGDFPSTYMAVHTSKAQFLRSPLCQYLPNFRIMRRVVCDGQWRRTKRTKDRGSILDACHPCARKNPATCRCCSTCPRLSSLVPSVLVRYISHAPGEKSELVTRPVVSAQTAYSVANRPARQVRVSGVQELCRFCSLCGFGTTGRLQRVASVDRR